MNRHREDVALVMDSADFQRDSHVRARTPGLAADLENVIVRPTILLHDRRYERRVEAAAGALAVQAAKLHALLAEPLTRPLGSMQRPRCFAGDEAITLIQNKPVGAAPPHLPPDGRHDRELAPIRRAELIGEKARTPNQLRHAASPASMRECFPGGDASHYKEHPTPTREALAADELRRAAEPALAGGGRLGADFVHRTAHPICDARRTEDNPRSMRHAGRDGGRHNAPRADDHARHIGPSISMRESEPGVDCHYAPMRDSEHLRHDLPAQMREAGSDVDHHYAAQPAPIRDVLRDDDRARHAAPLAQVREFAASRGRHYAEQPAPMRDSEHLRHDLPATRMREVGSGDDRYYSSRPASVREHSRQAAAQLTPMCEELPTADRRGEPAADAGTYHGLRHVREHAHARLESLEAAAVSGKTAVARPRHAARNAVESVLRSTTGKRRRSEGLTDARNALRRAYAESKLRVPEAPSRSSARSAGVVDGWERLPSKKSKRARACRKSTRATWPWAAALAVSSMFFAYTLTLTVVPEAKLVQRPQPIATETAPKAPPSPAVSSDRPPEHPTAIIRPRATNNKPSKAPTRAVTRTECRDQTHRAD